MPPRRRKRRLSPRLILAVVLLAAAVIFCLQNSDKTDIQVLIPVVTMPLWLALAGMLVVGLAVGWLLRRR